MKPNIVKKNKSLFLFIVFSLGIISHLNAQIITTYAGIGPTDCSGSGSFSGDDGPATNAALNGPGSLCLDRYGNLYIIDAFNYRIRKVNTEGIITTYAGNGAHSCTVGESATATGILAGNIRMDKIGNLFLVSPSGSSIYKIDTAGIITNFAGIASTPGNTGDGGPATAAEIEVPTGSIAVDETGNLYFGNSDYSTCTIRRIDTSGIIKTISGINPCGDTGDGGPATTALIAAKSLAIDRYGNIFF